MNFEDKADQKISEDVSILKEKLQPLDEKLTVPSSLHPVSVSLQKEKRTRYFKAIAIAASVAIIPFALWTLNQLKTETKIKKINKKIEQITQKVDDNGVSYDDVKQVYLAIKKRNDLVSATDGNRTFGGALKNGRSELMMADKANLANSTSVSKTNVQVDGVDEADIVKTDGKTFFSVSNVPYYTKMTASGMYQEKSTVQITSSLRTGEMKLLHSIQIDGNVSELYLKDDLLVIINQPTTEYYDKKGDKKITSKEYFDLMQENNNIISNQSAYEEFYKNYVSINKTSARIYDVSKPDAPVLKREFSQDGFYQSSRLVNNHLYLISNAPKEGEFESQTKEEDVELNQIIPYSQDSLTENKETLVSGKCITISPNPTSFQYVVLSGLDISAETEAQTVACLGGGSTIYANEKSLYVLAPEYSDLYGTTESNFIMIDRAMPFSNKTNIKKFNLNNGAPKLFASGTLPGGILNQFSLDEFEGNLRVAVTEYGEKQSNSIYVLNENLETIGKITELAPGERIYSVRFMGEKGYVVTYKQVDPLFALDLKEPTNPKVTGELKIPGFSEYLHPYSDGFLIGIGNDTKPNDHGGEQRNGMKISMFDVRDPLSPKEVQSLPIGDTYSYSEILQNHKALLYSKEKNLIGFPVQTNGSNEFFVFKILENKGFELIGKVSQKPADWEKRESMLNYGNNYSYSSMIQRGILIDDVLYTVSVDGIKASSIHDFKPISQVDFPE
ncbi:MAG: secreted protein with C-terminal beta-propeller domain [Bacillales bacterium]|nr:secreted protein with C-terminal beta-propeller domain [Bacillales bacterium]